jgi:hypothetical protein
MRAKCLEALALAKLRLDRDDQEEKDRQCHSSFPRRVLENFFERVFGKGDGDTNFDHHADSMGAMKELSCYDFKHRYTKRLPELSCKPDMNYWNMSDSVKLNVSKDKGRQLVAGRYIAPGRV